MRNLVSSFSMLGGAAMAAAAQMDALASVAPILLPANTTTRRSKIRPDRPKRRPNRLHISRRVRRKHRRAK